MLCRDGSRWSPGTNFDMDVFLRLFSLSQDHLVSPKSWDCPIALANKFQIFFFRPNNCSQPLKLDCKLQRWEQFTHFKFLHTVKSWEIFYVTRPDVETSSVPGASHVPICQHTFCKATTKMWPRKSIKQVVFLSSAGHWTAPKRPKGCLPLTKGAP